MVGQAGNQRGERSVSPSNCEGANGRDTMTLKDGVSTNLGIYPHFREEARVNGFSRVRPVRVAALKTSIFIEVRLRT
jgi:hypothetical protein